jgi:LPXTG-site transpeptidase (sortase) family protein
VGYQHSRGGDHYGAAFVVSARLARIMKLHKKLFYTSLSVLTIGIVSMVPYVNMWADRQAALAAAAPVVVQSRQLKPETISGKPVRLEISSLGINLEVADGAYNQSDGSWTLSKDKAHFALPTTQPNNEGGNTLIYGHYRKEVFEALHTIEPGSTAVITTDNGYKFTYILTTTETVAPSNTAVFTYQGAPRLTIQTCTGRWFEHRQLFYFALSGYQKVS